MCHDFVPTIVVWCRTLTGCKYFCTSVRACPILACASCGPANTSSNTCNSSLRCWYLESELVRNSSSCNIMMYVDVLFLCQERTLLLNRWHSLDHSMHLHPTTHVPIQHRFRGYLRLCLPCACPWLNHVQEWTSLSQFQLAMPSGFAPEVQATCQQSSPTSIAYDE